MIRLVAASLLSAAFAAPAFAEDLQFELINQTSQVLDQFYASPSNTNEWGEDILGQDVLGAGESGTVTIADGSDQCEYDLKSVFQSGEEVVREAADLCETGSYTLTEE